MSVSLAASTPLDGDMAVDVSRAQQSATRPVSCDVPDVTVIIAVGRRAPAVAAMSALRHG